MIFGADNDVKDHNSSDSKFIGWRSSFGSHAIISSPLILSFDLTSNDTDAYWPIISNKEAIAVNQQWAGSVGGLVKKWNPEHLNESSPLFVWGVDCDSAEAKSGKWVSKGKGKGSLVWQPSSGDGNDKGEPLCLEDAKGSTVGVRACNASNDQQGFYLNYTYNTYMDPCYEFLSVNACFSSLIKSLYRCASGGKCADEVVFLPPPNPHNLKQKPQVQIT